MTFNGRCLNVMITLAKSIQNEFDPAGNSQLVENPEQVVLDRVLGQLQALSNLAIGQSLRHAADHIRFSCGKQPAIYVEAAGEGRLGESFEHVFQFHTAGPNLPAVHAPNTFGQQAEWLGAAEHALSTGSKRCCDQSTL